MIRLRNRFGSLAVDPLGGRVVSWVPAGGEEVVASPVDLNVHPVTPVPQPGWVHGGIPVCFPWFGTNGPAGSVLHGLVHDREWSVVSESSDRVSLATASDAATKAWFEGDFRLRLDVTLAESLALKLTIENTGGAPFAYTDGFHPYLRVGDAARVSVSGLEGLRYWFGAGMGEEPWQGPVTFGVRRDHVFWTDGQTPVLADPVLGRRLTVSATGNRRFVVWNPGPEGCDGLAADVWRGFVCVEPATIPAADGFTIRPGERQTLEVNFTVDRTKGKMQ